jgi:hypothetical protein
LDCYHIFFGGQDLGIMQQPLHIHNTVHTVQFVDTLANDTQVWSG